MNYAIGKDSRAPIEYYCEQCAFTTFDQGAEKDHYFVMGHFTRSRVRADLSEPINNPKDNV